MSNEENFKILVAEDEEINFLYIQEVLSGEGIEIIHARNGKETIELFGKDPGIDLILMDLKMPVLNGYDAMYKIRQMNNEIPIIAQTAYAMPNDKQKALNSGFNDYIVKPVKKDAINEIINSYR